jgi:hypothetical protein
MLINANKWPFMQKKKYIFLITYYYYYYLILHIQRFYNA